MGWSEQQAEINERAESGMPSLAKEEWSAVAARLEECRKCAEVHVCLHSESPVAVILHAFWCTLCSAWLWLYKCAVWCKRELRPTRFPFYAAAFVVLTWIFAVWAQPLQSWIELWNGATWPEAASRPVTIAMAAPSRAAASGAPAMRSSPLEAAVFGMVLALRTMLNLGGIMGVVALVFAYRLVGDIKMYELGFLNIMHYRDTWISTRISAMVKADPTLPDERNKELFKVEVRRLGIEFDEKVLPRLAGSQGMEKIRREKIVVTSRSR